jgi:hypothetical protein
LTTRGHHRDAFVLGGRRKVRVPHRDPQATMKA